MIDDQQQVADELRRFQSESRWDWPGLRWRFVIPVGVCCDLCNELTLGMRSEIPAEFIISASERFSCEKLSEWRIFHVSQNINAKL